MATKAYYSIELSKERINKPQAYRIALSYGTFSIRPQWNKKTQRFYCYANKRAGGKLYKRYVGKYGKLTLDDVYAACRKISNAADRGGGLKDNRARGR